MNDLISKKKAEKAVSPVQVILNLSPRHFKMIQHCAELKGRSIEKWIMCATEAAIRGDVSDFEALLRRDYIENGVDFDDHDIDEIFGGAE